MISKPSGSIATIEPTERKWIDMKMESEYSPVVKAAYARIKKEILDK